MSTHDEPVDALFAAAIQAQSRAYVPYSHFPVGAAVECADGTIVSGANVENASYPLACCAERVALYAAAAGGHREFRRLLVVGPGTTPIVPCGGCRQVMAEFGDFEVVMCAQTAKTEPRRMSVTELLPLRFGAESLDGL